jgi:hypothetical protein
VITIEEQNKIIEEKTLTIGDLNKKVDNFFRDYEANMRKSEEY